ncbi:putative monooxygenase [Beauveria bassiana D1-5]|uniref:Putative monooxygenase n=1 Tax=Beauveria bassiana D1-5 TaxID=1245745 RepID=A0A0A2VCC2_BEABA|nr:putative monooxygenase [Beauveria bassiana D1-5]
MSPSVHLAPTTVVIIGAGFAGICMASTLQLRLSVYDYCIYDRNADIGGVWYKNTYPGCAVDIPGFCYSLSFGPRPNYSRMYPPQREILEYLDSVARHFGVHQHFTGSRDWTGSSWNDGDQEWTIELQDVSSGQRYIQRCQFLISCVGGLTNPRQVLLPGMDCFRGAIMHTARWDHEVKFDDKRVVVIGNGASAAQLIPALAGTPSHITQVMRTPEYLVPSSDRTLSRVAQLLLRWMPGPWLVIRMLIFIYMEMTLLFFQKSKVGEIGRKISEQESLAHMRESTPSRRIFNKAYTAALHRPDVDVVRGHVTQVQEFSVVLNQGQEIDADIIVFATGFETSQYDTPMQGSGGETRLNHWKKRGHKSTYKSVAMSGFPNMFFVLGPNSGRLHTSTLLSIEWHSEYITRVIKPIIIGNKGGTVQVRARDENMYQARLLEALKYTVHDASCSSVKWDALKAWQYAI